MAQRSSIQMQHLHQLITNIKSEGNTGYSFDMSILDDIFILQRVPFYLPSVLDVYAFLLPTAISNHMNGSLKSKQNSHTSRSKTHSIPKSAIVTEKYLLHSLTATHPQYGRIEFIPLNNYSDRDNGKVYFQANIYLFNNRKDQKLLCKMQNVYVLFHKNKSKLVQEKRLKNQSTIKKNVICVNDFKFINNPLDVGEFTKSAVFLGDLQWNDNFDIFVNALITTDNGFDTHPWITGSGDHLNGQHILNCCKQFIYLLIRNCNQLQFNVFMSCFKIFVTTMKVMKPQHLAIYDVDLQFKQYLELGQFVLKLLSLKMIKAKNNEDNSLWKFKAVYGFEVEVSVEQNQKQCNLVRVCACPVFSSSML
eukprot:194127_1